MVHSLLARIQDEFCEMPGLKLTAAQAGRFWGLTALESESVLAALVDEGFLRRTSLGAYLRTGRSPQAVSSTVSVQSPAR